MAHDHAHDHGALYAGVQVTQKPRSETEITGEIPLSAVEATRDRAVRRIVRDLELPGFRKGYVPADMAVAHVGELAVLRETAELVLAHAYPHLVEDMHLEVIGRPHIQITKLAPGNPIEFKITTAVFPAVTLPDYRTIAQTVRAEHEDPNTQGVSDTELDAELTRLRTVLARANREGTGEDTSEGTTPVPIDDAFAQELGDFKDLADLKDKVRKGLLFDKTTKAHDKRRLAIMDAILAKTSVEVPDVLVSGELDQMFAEFTGRVERAGMRLEQYLTSLEKTETDLRREWRQDAEKRAKLQLVLGEIAKREHLEPEAMRVERDVAYLTEHYPDADPSAARTYSEARIKNDMVFALLEGKESGDRAPLAFEHGS